MPLRARTAAGLLVLTLCGAAVRLDRIAEKSISHPEMWAPLIPLPQELADPPERPTLRALLNYNLGVDTHPPGYYLFLWAWMKGFGASIRAIRLPSVLFGALSIPLLWWTGRLAGLAPAACWTGAALLAFNGYHAAWSGLARMYSMACFLGLLSTALLLRGLSRRGGRRGRAAYFLVTLAGLSVNVFVWPLLAAQILWLMWETWRLVRPLPEVWRTQVLTLIAASPLLTFAAFQSHHNVAPLSARPWTFAGGLAAFGYLIPVDGLTDLHPHGPALPPWTSAPFLASAGLAAILLARGGHPRGPDVPPPGNAGGAPRALGGAWVAASLAAITLSAVFLWGVRTHTAEIRGATVAAALPLLFTAAAAALARAWPALPAAPNLPAAPALAAFAAGPVLLLAVFAAAHPIFIPRGLLVFAPCLWLLLAAGLTSLWNRRRFLGAAAATLAAALHARSLAAHRGLTVDPVDFAAFAASLTPELRADDLIFIKKSWHGTPLLFYVRPPQRRVFAAGYAEAARRNPRARIWCVTTYGDPLPGEALAAVHPRRRREVVQVEQARAELYVPD